MKYVVNCRFISQKTTGVQRFAHESCLNTLDILGSNVEFVCPRGKFKNELDSKLMIKEIGIFKGHLWEQIDLPLYCFFKKRILISFCGLPPIFFKNTIYTIHDIAHIRFPEFFNFIYRWVYKIVVKISYKRILSINTVSYFTRNEVIDFFGLRKINILNNSVNYLLYNQKKDNPKVKILKEIKNKKYILVVGSLDPRKNLQNLIDAFIKENDDDYFLLVVGSENKVFKNKSPYIKDKKIIFTGYLSDEDLYMCYKKAQCFFYPSLYEGFGIPPLEAIFYNTPIAISDIKVHKEIFGEYAFYFDPLKIGNIKNIISKAQEIKEKNTFKGIHINHPLVIKYSKNNQRKQLKKILRETDETS